MCFFLNQEVRKKGNLISRPGDTKRMKIGPGYPDLVWSKDDIAVHYLDPEILHAKKIMKLLEVLSVVRYVPKEGSVRIIKICVLVVLNLNQGQKLENISIQLVEFRSNDQQQ
eukprot:TRINITY_DN214_c0_g2_i10.p1 TRINITY_DN214_c0_g2~~TRINITY_DN214_c0_g2_i10.p1  ORF type:complete len:112 (+),score=13.81 TRINITY_DN214_c0_g2_i10:398-733(+)